MFNKQNFRYFFRILRNKYILTSILFMIWLLFFDQNNLLDRRKYVNEYKQLLKDREYYLEKIEEDKKRLEELQTNDENLEKFAREQYLMKKDGEDIFIIREE
ncbi:MAG: septum formation inhibitor [Bacteroidales bacterium]|nr:septum formation inhibitor [Bacteroidales bacterium]